jgi:hypothetical protein
MVNVYQTVLGAVSTMILVPVGVVLLYGLLAGRWDAAAISNWRESRRQKAERRRNLRAMRRQQGVPLEQVASRRVRCCRSSTIWLSIPLEWSGTSSGFGSRPSLNGLASYYRTGDTVRRPERLSGVSRDRETRFSYWTRLRTCPSSSARASGRGPSATNRPTSGVHLSRQP